MSSTKLFLTLALAATAAAQDECPPPAVTVSCVQEGDPCDSRPEAGAEFRLCGVGFLCGEAENENVTAVCEPSASVGSDCSEDDDCRDLFGDLTCFESKCARRETVATTKGCRQPGDDCAVNEDCDFGDCSGGVCVGIAIGGDCASLGFGDNCVAGAYCTAEEKCAAKIANGQPSDESSISCESGATDMDGNCSAVTTVELGEDCSASNKRCKFGTVCSFPEGTCVEEPNDGDSCDNDVECGAGGVCVCGICDKSCSSIAEDAFNAGTNGNGCGSFIGEGGRCSDNDGINEEWSGSCRQKNSCSALEVCQDDLKVDDVTFAPNTDFCGYTPPSECGSAALTSATWTIGAAVAVMAVALN